MNKSKLIQKLARLPHYAALAVLSLAAGTAWADRLWTGAVDTDWSSAGNWDDSSGTYCFKGTGWENKALVTFGGYHYIYDALWVQNDKENTYPLVFRAADSSKGIESSAALNVAPDGTGDGSLVIEEGVYTFSAANIGGQKDGSLLVKGGSFNSTGMMTIGCNSGTKTGTLALSGGKITVGNSIEAGSTAGTTGAIIVSNGTFTAKNYTCLGVNGTGVFEMQGGVYNQTGNAFIVGQGSGIGTATVTNGTMNLTGYAGNYDTDNSLYIGEGDGGGTMTIGGKAIVNATKKILVGVKGEGTLNITGGTTTSSEEMRVGVYGKGAGGKPGHVNMSGGELDVNTLTIGRGGIGDMTVSGSGRVTMQNDSYVGYNTSGTLTIRDGGWATCGYSGHNKWLKLNGNSSTTGTGTLNLDTNGVLEVMSIKTESGNGDSIINFNGGTLRAYADESKGIVQNNEKLSVIVKVGGAIIDIPSGITTEVNRPLLTDATSTGGGLTKLGAGTLALVTDNTYTGATIVEGGTLDLPDGAFASNTPTGGLVLKGGSLSGTSQAWPSLEIAGGAYSYSDISSLSTGVIALSGGTLRMTATEAADSTRRAITVTGGRIVVDGSTAATPPEAGSTLTITGVTLSGVAESAVFVVSCTPTLDWTAAASGSDYVLTAATATDTSVNVWIGGASGTWNTASNWKYGVPTSAQAVQIDDDCMITITQSQDIGSLAINGNVKLSGNSDWKGLVLKSGGISGSGSLALVKLGGFENGTGSKQVVLPSLDICSDGETWISGSEWEMAGATAIHSNQYRLEAVTTFSGPVTLDSAKVWIRKVAATFSGAVAATGASTFSNESGSGTLTVSGNISGTGSISSSLAATLSGDNSGFTGSFTTTVSGTTFNSASSGSAAADWMLKGNVFIGFSAGTIEFGSLDFSNYNDSSTFAYDYSDNADGATVTVKVGAKGDSTITETGSSGHRDVFTGYSGNTWTGDKFNGTIQKVGANTTLTLSGTPTAIDSLQIDAGTLILPDGVTVGTLTLASGVCVRPAISYDSGYTVAKLTATSATVTGAKIQLSDDSISALGTGKGGTSLEIIEAPSGGLTGSADAVVYTAEGLAVNSVTDAKTLWTASTANDKVSISASVLATANETPYYSLADAVEATQDTGALITLNLDTAENVLIPAGKTISFTAGSANYRGTVKAADGTVVTANSVGIYTYTCPFDFNEVDGVEGSATYSRTNIDNSEPLDVATGNHYFTNWRLDVPSDDADKQGSLVLSNGTKLDVHNEVQIGVKDNGVGSLTVTGGAILDADTNIAIGHGTGSTATLKADNGTVTTDGKLYLGCHSGGTGSSGTSTVDVRNSGSVTAKGIGLPNAANSTHTINLTGDGTGTINFGGGERAYLGQGNPSETALTIDGAKVSGIGIISMGYGNNVTSRLNMVSGELTMTDKFDMGELSGGYAKLVQSGGAITATAMQLGGNYQDSTKTAYGIAEFSGGSFSVNEVYFGWSGKGNGSITVSGDANVSLGAVDFGKNAYANTSEAVALNGGTLAVKSWTRSAVAYSTVMTFNGGTLKATAASSDWIPSGITKVFGGALTFESDNNVTINMANSSGADATTPSLTKTGTGTLTLSDASVFTGGITLSAGSLVLPSSYENVTSGVAGRIAARTTSGSTSTWILAGAAVVSGETTTYKETVEAAITDALAAESYDYVLVYGDTTLSFVAASSGVKMKADGDAQITVSLPNEHEYQYASETDSNGVTTYTFSNKACAYTWAGAAEGPNWNAAGNWRYNATETATRVPTASDSVIFPTGDWIVKIADSTGTDKFGTMTVNGNVTLQRSGSGWVYLQCNGDISGTGTLLLDSCCLYNNSSDVRNLACKLAVINKDNDSAMIGSGGSWNISGDVEIRGFFKSDNIPTVVTGNATIKTNAKFQTYNQPITFTGTTTFESSYERASKGGTLTFGNIIVAGAVVLPSVDSTAINGTVTINDQCSLTLPSSNISLSNASFVVTGGNTGSATAPAELALGTGDSDNTITLTGGVTFTTQGNLLLGAKDGAGSSNTSNNGTIVINSGATLEVSQSGGTKEFIVGRRDYCTGTINVNGGTMTVGNGKDFMLGFGKANSSGNGKGVLNVTAGTVTSSQRLYVGGSGSASETYKPEGWGVVNVTGGTLQLNNDVYTARSNGSRAEINVGGGVSAASVTVASGKTLNLGNNPYTKDTTYYSLADASTMVTLGANGTLTAHTTVITNTAFVFNTASPSCSLGALTINGDVEVQLADDVTPEVGTTLISWSSLTANNGAKFKLVGKGANRISITQDSTGLKVAAPVVSVTSGDVTTSYATVSDALSAAAAGDTVTLLADYSSAVTLDKAVTLQVAAGKAYTGTITASAGEIVATGDELATAFAGATINVQAAGSVTIPAGITLTDITVGDGGTVNVSGTITGTTVDANGTISNGSTLFTLTAATPAFAATTVHAVALDADIHYTMSAVESPATGFAYTAGATYWWISTDKTSNYDARSYVNAEYWSETENGASGTEIPTVLDTAVFSKTKGASASLAQDVGFNVMILTDTYLIRATNTNVNLGSNGEEATKPQTVFYVASGATATLRRYGGDNNGIIYLNAKLLGSGTLECQPDASSNHKAYTGVYISGDTSGFAGTGIMTLYASNQYHHFQSSAALDNSNSKWRICANGTVSSGNNVGYTWLFVNNATYKFGVLEAYVPSRSDTAQGITMELGKNFDEPSWLRGSWPSKNSTSGGLVKWLASTATFTQGVGNAYEVDVMGGGKLYVEQNATTPARNVPTIIKFAEKGGTIVIDETNADIASDIVGKLQYVAEDMTGTVGFDVASGITASATGRDTFSGASFKKSGYGTVSLTGAFESIGAVTVTEGKLIISTTISSELPIAYATSAGTLCEVSEDKKTYTFYTAAVTYNDKSYSTIADAVAAAKAASDSAPAITLNVSSSESLTITPGVSLSIANGATYSGVLTVDVTSTELNTTVLTTSGEGTFSGTVSFADATIDTDIFEIAKSGSVYTYQYKSTVYVWTGADATSPNAWGTAENWQTGGSAPANAPGSYGDVVYFPDGVSEITLSEDVTVGDVVFGDNAVVKISGSDHYVNAENIRGSGTLKLNKTRVSNINASDTVKDLTIAETVTLDIAGDTNHKSYLRHTGASKTIYVYGSITGASDSYLVFDGDYSSGSIHLCGNDAEFYGTAEVINNDKVRLRFDTEQSTMPNALLYCKASTAGTVQATYSGDNSVARFGGLKTDSYKVDDKYYHRFGEMGGVLEIGSRGDTSAEYVLGQTISEGSKDRIRLRKVGSSTLKVARTRTTYGADIDGGVLELVYDGAITENIQSDKFVTFGGGTLRYGTSCTNNTTKIVTDISAHVKNSTSAISVETTGTDVSWDTALDASNTGGITKKGAGTLTLTKKPLMTKPTITVQDSGTLVISNATALVAGTDFTCGDWTVCEETANKDDPNDSTKVTSYTYTFRMFSVTVSSSDSTEVTGTDVSVDGTWIAANMSGMTMEQASTKLKSAAVADHASNGYSYLANYALGLDPAEVTSKPFVAGAASASNEGKIAIKLSGIKVPEGVTVTAQLMSGTMPDGTFTDVSGKTGTATGTAEGVTETSAIEVDASAANPVIYYRLGVTFGGTVKP